ncbi:PhoU domain-containing protein [Natrarchaeobaculum sulfurireducens]|uniref:ABC transport system regulatory protein n=1 Tax=Natrarchaeobaculum sulfurireducens TaxID=2044521 RepID=A0A346PL77_9EURY|nr:PhoU domain-containing protein [Natrarchaeobaculum sulfurireducens]AXR76595.1 Phosphate uptake regulator [Natrarchaeobaculum sulfurireducens]AXR80272.1 ABC transport system regulatory protein [Natrarchaeobaculum sulfurireducens]
MHSDATTDGTGDPVERTVQIAGNSTFVVSLPKAWAVEQGLESGSSMTLYPQDDRLVVATEAVSTPEPAVTIDASVAPEAVTIRRVERAYLIGCDRITVTGLETAPGVRRTVERIANRLVGVTIQDDGADRLTIANVLDVSEVSLPQTVAQIQRLVLEMHVDACTAVVAGDELLARRVIDRDDDVDRLFAFVSRGVHRGFTDVHELDRLETTRAEAFREYRVARSLERVADHATEIAHVAIGRTDPPADAIADRFDDVGADARAVLELALAGDIGRTIESAADLSAPLEDLERRCSEGSDSDAGVAVAVRRLRRTVAAGREIADVRIESTLTDDDTPRDQPSADGD